MRVLAGVVIVSIIEISLFVTVGGWLTLWPTLGIVVGTAFAGGMLVRWQGTHLLRSAQREMVAARNPIPHLAHGMLISVAGVLLILPGFFTDMLGLILLLPPVRHWIIWLARMRIADTAISALHGASRHPDSAFRPAEGAIDGEFFESPGAGPEKPGASGWTRP